MKSLILSAGLILMAGSSFANSKIPGDICTFSVGPNVVFKALYGVSPAGAGIVNNEVDFQAADGTPLTTLKMKMVATQDTKDAKGNGESVRFEITGNAKLPDPKGIVLYDVPVGYEGTSPAVLLMSTDTFGSQISGTCTYRTTAE
jgi:hypothetical protein